MLEWAIIAIAALTVVLYRLKAIHIDFRDNDKPPPRSTPRKQLSE
jgi:hypothetical protein